MAQLGKLREVIQNTGGAARQNVSVTVYREGAIVNGAQSGTSPLTVTVRHNGKIKLNDSVFVNTSTSTQYTVSTLSSNTSLILTWAGGTTLSLLDGDVLVPSNNKPTLYSDDQGASTTTNPLTSDSAGTVTCWTEAGAVEMLLSGSGITTKLLHGEIIPTESPAQVRWADNFAANSSTGGIQEAIDDLPSAGGHVHCSARTYSTSTSLWLHSGVALHLNGALIQRAPGTLTNGSASNSGTIINVSAKGSNGTVPADSSASLSNISILGPGIIDGNQASFAGSLTNTNTTPAGISIRYTDGVIIDRVRIQNTLMDGLTLIENRNVHVDNLTEENVGQWGTVSSRNGISLNNYLSSSGWAERCTISNVTMKNIGDEAIGGSMQWNDVTINGLTVDGCDIVIEIGNNTLSPASISGWSVNNVVAKNTQGALVTFQNTGNFTYSDMFFSNMRMTGSASLHSLYAISFQATGSYSNIHFDNVHCTNLNSALTASARWINIQPDSSNSINGLWISNSSFEGPTLPDTNTGDIGLLLRGNVSNVYIDDVEIRNVRGQGIAINDSTYATSLQKIHFRDLVVESCNYDGVSVVSTGSSAHLTKEIYFDRCVTINCAIVSGTGATTGWRLGISNGSGSIDHIYFANCRSYKTTGATHLYGVNLFQSAGTLGPVFLDGCDFSVGTPGTQTAEAIVSGGTVTNLRCSGEFAGAAQTITAVGNAITLPSLIKNCTIRLNADNNYTLTSAPTLANGFFEGQIVRIINEDTADTITIQDQGTLASSNLRLSANTIALAPRDNITLIWNGTIGDWVQLATTNVL